MGFDYDDAKARITAAFCRGVVRQYGLRRIDRQEIEMEQPGAPYWDPAENWVDPTGTKRRGRFKRLPSRKVPTVVEVPQGVVPTEIEDYAGAVAEAFIEVLRIVDEQHAKGKG